MDRRDTGILVSDKNIKIYRQYFDQMTRLLGVRVLYRAPIDSSNVMIVCPACDKATRPAMKVIDGKKVRVCKKCGEQLDV